MKRHKGERYRGRIAPTPSGYLHLGHIETFSKAMSRALERNGELVLRIEDIDGQRCKKEYIDACVEDLSAAGIVCSEGFGIGGKYGPYLQSLRMRLYRAALLRLIKLGAVYPCDASRSEISKLASPPARRLEFAPEEGIFPIGLRTSAKTVHFNNPFSHNWRFKVDAAAVEFTDGNFGAMSMLGQRDFGDFIVWRKSGGPSYELAVVVDDFYMQISEVVRGQDLLVSTARQLLLYKAFGWEAPDFYHCPLVKDEKGKKLSKSTMGGFDKKYLVSPRRANTGHWEL